MSRGYLHLLDRALARTEHDAEVISLARSTVATLRDDLAELDAARARIAELEAAVKSLHYRMTCVDPAPTWDEIVDTLARARKD